MANNRKMYELFKSFHRRCTNHNEMPTKPSYQTITVNQFIAEEQNINRRNMLGFADAVITALAMVMFLLGWFVFAMEINESCSDFLEDVQPRNFLWLLRCVAFTMGLLLSSQMPTWFMMSPLSYKLTVYHYMQFLMFIFCHTMLSIRSLISSNLDLLQKTITRYEFDISAKNMNSILLVVFTGFSIFFALLRVFKLRR